MTGTVRSSGGMVTAPHALAAQCGARILGAGGNAIEAALGTAAMLTVVYPHMTGLGGDSFWLIAEPGRAPFTIDGAGRAGAAVNAALYQEVRPARSAVAGSSGGQHRRGRRFSVVRGLGNQPPSGRPPDSAEHFCGGNRARPRRHRRHRRSCRCSRAVSRRARAAARIQRAAFHRRGTARGRRTLDSSGACANPVGTGT